MVATLQIRLTKCDLTFARCCKVQSQLLYVLVYRHSNVVCQVLVARHCMGRHTAKSSARCSQGVGGATRAQAGPLPTLPRLFSPSVKGGLGADMRTALCAHTHRACVHSVCKNMHKVCTHVGRWCPFEASSPPAFLVTVEAECTSHHGCEQLCTWLCTSL